MNDESAGVAIAGFALASVVLNRLKVKGILDPKEIVDILDQCLLVMEQLGLSGDATLRAHALIETTLRAYEQDGHPPQAA